ncbi:hypothetical protein HDU78_001795 [Chytriomyces hyalinus]|nr:hypothetical protein HDU78_001795 [Chytriomyces hyalinus]
MPTIPALLLLGQLARCVLAIADNPLQYKNQSSITFALVGPYSFFPSIVTNGALVIGGYDSINVTEMSDLDAWSETSWWYFNQLAATLAINRINRDPNILPNTTIQIKRFDTECGGSKHSASACAIQMALDVGEHHKDVVAAVGEFKASSTIYSGQIFGHFQTPLCGATQSNPRLFNKNKYPYFFESDSSIQSADAYSLVLKSWNVKRVAILSQFEVYYENSYMSSFVKSLRKRDIIVVSALRRILKLSINHIVDTLTKANAKYIIFYADPNDGATFYLSLARIQKLVGPEYVWMSVNPIFFPSNGVDEWGPKYYEASRGVTLVYFGDPIQATSYSVDLANKIVADVQEFQAPWGASFDRDILYNYFNYFQMTDCANVLAAGIDKISKEKYSGVAQMLESPDFRADLSFKGFQNTGYRGFGGDPFTLTNSGDVASPGTLYSFNGSAYDSMTAFGFTSMDQTKVIYFEGKRPQFFDGTSNPPSDGSNAVERHFSCAQEAVLYCLLISGSLISGVFVCVVFMFWTENPIRTGGPTYLVFIGLGSMLSFLSNLLYLGDESVLKNRARLWMQISAFAIAASASIVKNWKLESIFFSKVKIRRGKWTEVYWMLAFAVMVCIDQILLLVLVVTSKPMMKKSLLPDASILYVCVEGRSLYGTNMRYAIVAYNLLLLLLTFRGAYTTLKISPTHSEWSMLLTNSMLWTVGFLLLPSADSLQTSLDARMREAVLIWISSIVPLGMQLSKRGLELYQLHFHDFARKLVLSHVSSSTKETRSLHQPTMPLKNVQVHIRKLLLFDVICALKVGLLQSKWHQGAITIMKVRHNTYLQFFPMKRDLESSSTAFPFMPSALNPRLIEPRLILLKLMKGELRLEFLSDEAANQFHSGILATINDSK